MAINCAGVFASWDGVALGEVTKIDIQRGGALPMARGSNWTLDAGAIEITSLSTAQLTAAQYGKKSTLIFTGGGLDATTKAICQTLRATGTVNDVTRYVGIFKISME
jgi:hypothetical protein